ncbi:MAG TPA: 2,3-bisphosphoglycerate-dependent phosphoglycerate mutase [Candidatus Saccharimonadia bacterium]
MSHLILVRHGESQFNAKSLWTGTWDVPLTDRGRHEAQMMAHAIKDLKPTYAFTSNLSRATETLEIILTTNHWKPKVAADAALAERDYGELTGMNKWVVEEKYGEAQFNKWRRGWDEPVPGGETLKQVYRRVIPYYESHILPHLKGETTVLLVAHGNSIRTLIKYLDDLSNEQVKNLEMLFGAAVIYTLDPHHKVVRKDTRKIPITPPPA